MLNTLQGPMDEISPITEDSPLMSDSQAELTGGPPIGGGDCPIMTPLTVKAQEGTTDSAPTVEHQAEVHSAALSAGADAEAFAAA